MTLNLKSRAAADGSQKLARLDGVPLHRQLFLVLQSAIQSGQYRRGDLFPTEEMLSRTYAVSRATVRRTLASLEGAGMIDRRQGAGTRVAGGASFHVEDAALESHLLSAKLISGKTKQKLIDAQVMDASPFLRGVLGLDDGAQVLQLKRVRSDGSVPIWYSFAFLAAPFGERLKRSDYSRLSMAELIQRTGTDLGEVDQTIGARLADADMAKALEVEIGAPLLEVFSTFIDASGDPLAFQRTYIPPERRRLRFARHASQLEGA
jgi:GntR family transcriptional regulator